MTKKRLPKNVRYRDGKYFYRYGITNPQTGKRKQKETPGFASAKEAEQEGIRIQAEMLRGTYVEEQAVVFEDFANEWLDYYASTGNVKISTVRVRKHEIGRLSAHFKRIKLKDITRVQYQKALTEMHKQYADNTLDGIHRTGRMIFRRAVEVEAIQSDPTEFAYVPKTMKTIEELEQEQIPKYMEKEELARFLAAARENGMENDYEVCYTLSYTGIRVGELCALKETDIDEVNQTVSITKTYYNPTNDTVSYQLLPPKTKSSRRVIDVDPQVIVILKGLISAQKSIKMANRKSYHDKKFIFTSTNPEYLGFPLYPKLIQYRMLRLLKFAGLPTELTPHSLRHTHTSLLAEAGASLEQIMARLGHSDDKTTKTIYLHVTKPKKKEAAHMFSTLMSNL